MRSARVALLLVSCVALVTVTIVTVAHLSAPYVAPVSAQQRAAPPLPDEVMMPPAVTLTGLRGKPAVINFWASWCDSCREEAPGLERLAMALRGHVAWVGVDWNDSLSGGRQFISTYHWSFPVLRDANGVAGEEYGVRGLPSTFLLDAKGTIVSTLLGPQTAGDIQAALTKQALWP